MSKIKDTTKRPRHDWTMGGNPNAIENQEREGQKKLADSNTQLPRKVNSGATDVREAYRKMGITITSEGEDSLFFNVELPTGWEVRPTNHSMWNNLVDDKGVTRATIFYKAAFYDRDAFINITDLF